MRVLIACEFSGIVRDAFRARGHFAYSCDLLPTEKPGPHFRMDVLKILDGGWDLMIAHPPCTYLSYAATHVWNVPGREQKRQSAMAFFMALVNAPIEKICVENPLGVPQKAYRRYDQIIHPYYFGDPQLKRTCLWLKNLPRLDYRKTDTLFGLQTATEYPEPVYVDKSGKRRQRTEALSSAHERSRFFPSVANAMAEQWG
jgi:hypothetical protein